jgi:hypothetical protein
VLIIIAGITAIGGSFWREGGWMRSPFCHRYDIASNQWINLPPLSTPRWGSRLISLNNGALGGGSVVYCVGGVQTRPLPALTTIDRWSPLEDDSKWVTVTEWQLPKALTLFNLVAFRDHLVLSGM